MFSCTRFRILTAVSTWAPRAPVTTAAAPHPYCLTAVSLNDKGKPCQLWRIADLITKDSLKAIYILDRVNPSSLTNPWRDRTLQLLLSYFCALWRIKFPSMFRIWITSILVKCSRLHSYKPKSFSYTFSSPQWCVLSLELADFLFCFVCFSNIIPNVHTWKKDIFPRKSTWRFLKEAPFFYKT